MKNNTLLFLVFALVLLASCGSDSKTETQATESDSGEEMPADKNSETSDDRLMIQDGRDDATADMLAGFLTADLLSDDLEYLMPEDRKFRYSSVDLNEDGTLEYLIEFRNSYFCGSGGCSYILVNTNGTSITEFSVSYTPFYVLVSKSNGWHDLAIPQGDGHNLMQYDGQSYPSNPSVQPVINLEEVEVAGELIADESVPFYEF